MKEARQWPSKYANTLIEGDECCGDRFNANASGSRWRTFYSGSAAPEQALVLGSAGFAKAQGGRQLEQDVSPLNELY